MQKYNIGANLVRTTEQLYDKATSAGQMNGSINLRMVQNNSWNKARMDGWMFELFIDAQPQKGI